MAKEHVKFQTPGDVQAKILEAVETSRTSGTIKKGVNETTKAVERGDAKLVVIAEDTDPAEIIMHLPGLCLEKKIPFGYVSDKASLGKAAGLSVPSAAVAITRTGGAELMVKEISQKLTQISAPAGVGQAVTEAKKSEKPRAVAAKPKK